MELQPETMNGSVYCFGCSCGSECKVQANVSSEASDLKVQVHSKPKPQT